MYGRFAFLFSTTKSSRIEGAFRGQSYYPVRYSNNIGNSSFQGVIYYPLLGFMKISRIEEGFYLVISDIVVFILHHIWCSYH